MPRTSHRRDLARRLLGRKPQRPAPRRRAPIPIEQQVLARATFGRNLQTEQDIQTMGWAQWLDWQLDPEAIDDSAVDALIQGLGGPVNGPGRAIGEFYLRLLFSRRQLAWRMTYFLHNHFNTDLQTNTPIAEINETRAFNEGCFGRFADVLLASAQSPAMIRYLDSDSNVAGAPNENYARELMELHTVGVNAGYTEDDVAEAARLFTGWSAFAQPTGPGTFPSFDVFFFRRFRHDTGPKRLAGIGFKSEGKTGDEGLGEGHSFLRFLAAHESTVQALVPKLCRYFVADDPPVGLVDRVKDTFRQTDGDLGETVRAIFLDAEFNTVDTGREKTQSGLEAALSILRRLQVQIGNPTIAMGALANRVTSLGETLHRNPVPTGYPEVGTAWQGVGNTLPRWNFAYGVLQNQLPQSNIPWAMVIGPPLPQSAAEWVDRLVVRLVDGDVPTSTRTELETFFQARLASLGANPNPGQIVPHLRDLALLILTLPEAGLH